MLFAIWLIKNHLGENQEYAPGTEGIALVKLDRDLRLSLAMQDDPPILRWVAHAKTKDEARRIGLRTLENLRSHGGLSPLGENAYKTLAEGGIAELFTTRNGGSSESSSVSGLDNNAETIRPRAVAIGGVIWFLAILGLAFVPACLRAIKEGSKTRPSGYASAWSPTLGMFLFLFATLTWIVFTTFAGAIIGALPGLSIWTALALEVSARLLPAFLAVAMLFRKPAHVVRTLGLSAPIHPPIILGAFAILTMVDQPVRYLLSRFIENDPAGGLSSLGTSLSGLTFLIISSCLIAPIAEEILYRGILFRSLANRLGVLAGALVSSVIFASLHFYGIYGFISVVLFGFISSLIYRATGSLMNAIFLHICFNLSVILPRWVLYHAPL